MAVWGDYMESMLRQQIQAACDAVYQDPDDMVAVGRLQRLLRAATTDRSGVEQPLNWHRLVRAACDAVYDAPEDPDARDRLMVLLLAHRPGTCPSAT